MKIILNLDEYVTLRGIDVNGSRFATRSIRRNELKTIEAFYETGLIRGVPLQQFDPFGPIYTTPLGRRVLRDHTPYLCDENARAKSIDGDRQVRSIWALTNDLV